MKAKVVSIPHPDKPAEGNRSDVWNNFVKTSVVSSLATSSDRHSFQHQSLAKTATLAGIAACDINDPLEAIIVGQIMSAHSTALELQRIAWIKGQPFDVATRYFALANKSARTVAVLIETLNRHRGKGQQLVRVEHVSISQAIVGNVHQGGGMSSESRDQPHAQVAYAPGTEMPCPIEKDRVAVPSTGDEWT